MSPAEPQSDESSGATGRFEPFDLSVNLGPNAIPWLSVSSRAGSVHGVPRIDSALPQLPELLDLVYDYTDAVQFAEPQSEPELSQILGKLVFGDRAVLQLFQATRGIAADRGRQLLVRILASPHLAALPWELLPDPGVIANGHASSYLAIAPDTLLVRAARGRSYAARADLLEAPLNLLIVMSSPTPHEDSEDWLPFDIFEVKRSLLAELSPLEQSGMLHIDVEDRPTLDNLRRMIGKQRRGYHLVHYVGHAFPDRLVLEDRSGRPQNLPSSQFMEILRLCPDLRLAVFAGCQTARSAGDPTLIDPGDADAGRNLLSLSDYCVQEACPYVIGMQAVLPFSTERVFTRFFYQALANGYTIAEALRLARGAIRGDERLGGDLLDWSVPALFVGSNEPGALLPRKASAARPPERTRSELKLGLRQSADRFLARELALRQAVDIMTGQEPERVLVITGPSGVGKTSLVDRALDELPEIVTHVLYVHFGRLAPEVERACAQLEEDKMPDLAELGASALDQVLERLCHLVNERLSSVGTETRPHDPAWKSNDWWERLIEEVVRHHFVIAIDAIGLLDRAQRGLLEQLIEPWITTWLDREPNSQTRIGLLDDVQAYLTDVRKSQVQNSSLPSGLPERLKSVPEEMQEYLSGLPGRLHVESHQVLGRFLERLLTRLRFEVAQKVAGNQVNQPRSAPDAIDRAKVLAALKNLDSVRNTLGSALRALASRRSPARIIITASDKLGDFLNLPNEQFFEMRLANLTWPETWRWIRRNLPALLSFGEAYLSQFWFQLGTRLDRWEELERRVLGNRTRKVELSALVQQIIPPAPRRKAKPGPPPRRGERALRIAVAGPNLAGPLQMAEAITRLATSSGIGGRVVVASDEGGALATLIDVPSPFDDDHPGITPEQVLDWLRRVLDQQPDIILLDYGEPTTSLEIKKPSTSDVERTLLRVLQPVSLVFAAGGHELHSSHFTAPAVYPETIAVGPLDGTGKLRPYAEWHPKYKKPDFFMADNLAASPLASAIKPQLVSDNSKVDLWGSSFAALHGVATAALVWSILPELSPQGVRELLRDASKPIKKSRGARGLLLGDAIALARRRVVEGTLASGPLSLQSLSSIAGLSGAGLTATLNSLIESGSVVKLPSGRMERYQLRD